MQIVENLIFLQIKCRTELKELSWVVTLLVTSIIIRKNLKYYLD